MIYIDIQKIIDEIKLSGVTYDIVYRLERLLKSMYFYLIIFKHFVDTNYEHVIEHWFH